MLLLRSVWSSKGQLNNRLVFLLLAVNTVSCAY